MRRFLEDGAAAIAQTPTSSIGDPSSVSERSCGACSMIALAPTSESGFSAAFSDSSDGNRCASNLGDVHCPFFIRPDPDEDDYV